MEDDRFTGINHKAAPTQSRNQGVLIDRCSWAKSTTSWPTEMRPTENEVTNIDETKCDKKHRVYFPQTFLPTLFSGRLPLRTARSATSKTVSLILQCRRVSGIHNNKRQGVKCALSVATTRGKQVKTSPLPAQHRASRTVPYPLLTLGVLSHTYEIVLNRPAPPLQRTRALQPNFNFLASCDAKSTTPKTPKTPSHLPLWRGYPPFQGQPPPGRSRTPPPHNPTPQVPRARCSPVVFSPVPRSSNADDTPGPL